MSLPPPIPRRRFQFTGLTHADRVGIVNRTTTGPGTDPVPVHADLLLLSALGAWLDLEGNWPESPFNNLAQWRQVTAQGRDHYVRIVRRGYLFPLGHPAVIIDIVERVFVVGGNGVIAYLQKKTFIRVNKPLKTYPAPGQAFAGRGWPFTSVLIVTEVSPPLKQPLQPFLPGDAQSGIPQTMDGEDVRWKLVAIDAAGNRASFAVPLAFVYGHEDPTNGVPSPYPRVPYDVGYARNLADAYNGLDPARRTGDTAGARVRYAPEAPDHPGGTTHPTVNITLAAATTETDPNAGGAVSGGAPDENTLTVADQPAFYPSLAAARPRLPAVDALSKVNDPAGPGVAIALYSAYVVNGLANTGTVYARALATPAVNFQADTVGGLATPNFVIKGLSAAAGPVGGALDGYANSGVVDPRDYFGGLADNAVGKLLGGLSLTDIIGAMGAPTIVTLVDQATKVRTVRYHLDAPLKPIAGVFAPASPGGRLTLDSVATFDPASGAGTYRVEGHIDAFTIQILGGALHFIDIPFNKIRFTASNATKPNVDVDIGQVRFAGALSFVNELQKFLRNLGGSGFSIKVSPSAIDAGMSLSLPSFGVGVFNMQNLALNAGIHVPFTGDGTLVRFGFCTREHPFLLTVMCFGGGGFVGLGVGLKQVELVEASLEFGAQLALDIGVASGGVTVTAGVYFKYEIANGVKLSGFVRVVGELEVLGLISISAEFNLSLDYQSKPNAGGRSTVGGTATLRVEISIAFFSTSAQLSVHREFAGADPSFADMIPDQPTWQAYCDAFAP